MFGFQLKSASKQRADKEHLWTRQNEDHLPLTQLTVKNRSQFDDKIDRLMIDIYDSLLISSLSSC